MERYSVPKFYDEVGWNISNNITYDAQTNENLSRIATAYVSKVRLRIIDHLGSGKNLLDVGCGPIQYPEYVAYSKNFKLRVCVDLSEKALGLAKQQIGNHGKFVKGDYLTLPKLGFEPYDGAALINVLYHVDKNQQANVVKKILSELNPGKKLVVVYSNPLTFSAALTQVAVKTKHLLLMLKLGRRLESFSNPIYFHRFRLNFWDQFKDLASVSFVAWRTFSPAIEKIFFRNTRFGFFALELLFRLESKAFWYKFCEYPMIILTKR